jgi:pilus assembly protein CpaE
MFEIIIHPRSRQTGGVHDGTFIIDAERATMTAAPKILIIDKDLDTLRTLSNLLEHENYEILTSSSGKDAAALVKAQKPDLIILDWVLPDENGLEIIRQLRSNPDTLDILIIILSALASPKDQLNGFEAGADDYLRKPTPIPELIARINSLMMHSASRSRLTINRKKNQDFMCGNGRLVGIMAAKGGVGVSSLAINLGIALHQLSQETVLVADFRPGCSTMAAEMGTPGSIGLEKLLSLDPETLTAELIENQLYHHKSGVNFLFASANPGDSRHIHSDGQFARIAQQLPFMSKFSIIDLGSCFTTGVRGVIHFLQEIILVMEPTPPSLLTTRLLLENIRQNQGEKQAIKIVLTHRSLESHFLTKDQVESGIRKEISAVMSYSPDQVLKAQLESAPVMLSRPESKFGSEYRDFARVMMNLKD